jgi:hypothetical protein
VTKLNRKTSAQTVVALMRELGTRFAAYPASAIPEGDVVLIEGEPAIWHGHVQAATPGDWWGFTFALTGETVHLPTGAWRIITRVACPDQDRARKAIEEWKVGSFDERVRQAERLRPPPDGLDEHHVDVCVYELAPGDIVWSHEDWSLPGPGRSVTVEIVSVRPSSPGSELAAVDLVAVLRGSKGWQRVGDHMVLDVDWNYTVRGEHLVFHG